MLLHVRSVLGVDGAVTAVGVHAEEPRQEKPHQQAGGQDGHGEHAIPAAHGMW